MSNNIKQKIKAKLYSERLNNWGSWWYSGNDLQIKRETGGRNRNFLDSSRADYGKSRNRLKPSEALDQLRELIKYRAWEGEKPKVDEEDAIVIHAFIVMLPENQRLEIVRHYASGDNSIPRKLYPATQFVPPEDHELPDDEDDAKAFLVKCEAQFWEDEQAAYQAWDEEEKQRLERERKRLLGVRRRAVDKLADMVLAGSS